MTKSEKEPIETSYDKIADTAILTAGFRMLADFPFAEEIYNAAVEISPGTLYKREKIEEMKEHALDIESRSVIAQDIIKESGDSQILYLGAGLTTFWLGVDPKTTFVEVDLPVLMSLKRRIISNVPGLSASLDSHPNVYLEEADVPDKESLKPIVEKHIVPGKPVTVVTGGLLFYLKDKEKEALAKNIGYVLDFAGNGSKWVTADMPVQEGISDRDKIATSPILAQTGVDIADNRFDTNSSAVKFFSRFGLHEIDRRPYTSVINRLKSPKRIGVDGDSARRKIAPWFVWTFNRSGGSSARRRQVNV